MLWRHKLAFLDIPEIATPTRIYAPLVRYLTKRIPILGMAHITGGGIPGNLPRCMPKGLQPLVDWNSWEIPDIFNKIMIAGDISKEEMWRVFNMGIGMVLITNDEACEAIKEIMKDVIDVYDIGTIIRGNREVLFNE